MDKIPKTFNSYINKITQKITYLDKYGGSVLATGLILFSFFLIFSYFYVMNKLKPIKKDWINQRCNPAVMPFAGLINAPPNSSKIEYTAENFTQCTQSILATIIGYFMAPINYTVQHMTEFLAEIMKSVNMIRHVFAYIRNKIMGIVANIFARIYNIIIPVQVILMKLKDILAKSVGVMTSALYTVMTLFLSMKAFLGAFLEIMVISLIILAAATILLWILPFTWPAAAAMTALFVAVSVPLAIIAIGLGDVLHITSSKNIPGKPGCFDEDTTIHLKNKFVKVKHLKPGDYLFDGSKVTAFFKISTHDKNMYQINKLIVSGSHKIRYNDTWISVKNHPQAIYLEEYSKPYIYCFNTTSKRIKIDEHILLDWDDVDDLDFVELKNLVSNFIQFNAPTSHIHSYLEGGFDKNTEIELEDGRCVNISEIKVNDQLRFGERVLGIVKIDTTNLSQVKKHEFKDKIIVGGPNIWIDDNDLGNFSTLGLDSESIEKPKRLYQILTDTGSFTIQGIKFMDYNSAIEQIMGDAWSMDQGLFSV
jgi:hypothetical protein